METDVLVLHDAPHEALAVAIGEALAHRGVSVDLGPPDHPLGDARVLVALSSTCQTRLGAGLARGLAVLPVRSSQGWLADGPLDVRARRVADAVEALLIIGRPPERNSAADLDGATLEIDDALDGGTDASPLMCICEALAVAIHWGAPIYNSGDVAGCARIYRSASAAVRRYIGTRIAAGAGHLLDAIADELDGVEQTLGALEDDAWDEQAWTLRHAFDRILIARRTADALYAIDDLFGGLARAGRSLNASLIYDIISVAISHGAPIYNGGSAVGCAQIYLCAAAGLLQLLGAEAAEGEGRSEPLARQTLTPLVAGGARRLEDDPDDLAWSLRRAFDGLVEAAAEERRWEHDS